LELVVLLEEVDELTDGVHWLAVHGGEFPREGFAEVRALELGRRVDDRNVIV
jgi:hypothetical protein